MPSTFYLYDGLDAVQETQGTTVNPILTGLGIDERYARNDTTGRTYYLTDHLGSTRALTYAAGNVVNRYDYDPYGNMQASNSAFTNPYQYTGRERDGSGLLYYSARYYSASMGRFISEDSYGFAAGDANFYAYALGNPVSYNDPSGWRPSRSSGVASRSPWRSMMRTILVEHYLTRVSAMDEKPLQQDCLLQD